MISRRAKYDFLQAIDNRIRNLRGRVRGLATRFVLGKTSRATGDLARARGETYSGDVTDSDEIMQNYGFASMPVNGAEGVRISVFSDGDHGVIVALDDRRYRPTLVDGETALYHKDGAKVHLKADGSIVLVPSGTDLVHIGADPASDFVPLAALVLSRLQDLHDWALAHVHSGVTTGLGSTAVATATVPPLIVTPASVAATKAKAT